jgi:hypothetical protein
MIKNELLAAEGLEIDFSYPKEYREFLHNKDRLKITPWWLIGATEGAFLVSYETINNIYKSTKLLIPFAKSDQSNILACFDLEHRVWLTSCERNDITNADWETRFSYKDFNSWLEEALNGEVF